MSAPSDGAELPSVREVLSEVLSETDETQQVVEPFSWPISKAETPRSNAPTSRRDDGSFRATADNGNRENRSKSEKENFERRAPVASPSRSVGVATQISQGSAEATAMNQEIIDSIRKQLENLSAQHEKQKNRDDDIEAHRQLWSPQSTELSDECSDEGIPGPGVTSNKTKSPRGVSGQARVEKLERPDRATTRHATAVVPQKKASLPSLKTRADVSSPRSAHASPRNKTSEASPRNKTSSPRNRTPNASPRNKTSSPRNKTSQAFAVQRKKKAPIGSISGASAVELPSKDRLSIGTATYKDKPVSPRARRLSKQREKASPRATTTAGFQSKGVVPKGEGDRIAFSEDMKSLAAMIFLSTTEPSPDDVKRLVHIIDFAFPHVRDRAPTASVVSRVMFEAKHTHLELDVTDRLLGLVHALHEQKARDNAKGDASSDKRAAIQADSSVSNATMHGFVKSLVTVAKKDPSIAAAMNGEDLEVSKSSFGDEDQAIEVDLKDGFIDKNLTLARSGDEPWWQIVARLQDEEIESNELVLSSHESHPQSSIEETVDKSYEKSFDKSFGSSELGSSTENALEYYPSSIVEEREFLVENSIIAGDTSTWTSRPFLSLTSSDYSGDTDEEESWIVRRSMAHWTKKGVPELWHGDELLAVVPVDEPERINAVDASVRLFTSGSLLCGTRDPQLTQQWKRPYKSRTERHAGYRGVQVHSLCNSSFPPQGRHVLDVKPWEHRTVRQGFLFERNVPGRNWFGNFRSEECKPMVGHVPVRVESIPMSVEAETWAEDWYQKPWPEPLDTNLSGASSNCQNASNLIHPSDVPTSTRSAGPYDSPFHDDFDDDDESQMMEDEDTIECGNIVNTQLNIGDRITLLTPDITSSLRRSRWRKKHFPRGTFPY